MIEIVLASSSSFPAPALVRLHALPDSRLRSAGTDLAASMLRVASSRLESSLQHAHVDPWCLSSCLPPTATSVLSPLSEPSIVGSSVSQIARRAMPTAQDEVVVGIGLLAPLCVWLSSCLAVASAAACACAHATDPRWCRCLGRRAQFFLARVAARGASNRGVCADCAQTHIHAGKLLYAL